MTAAFHDVTPPTVEDPDGFDEHELGDVGLALPPDTSLAERLCGQTLADDIDKLRAASTDSPEGRSSGSTAYWTTVLVALASVIAVLGIAASGGGPSTGTERAVLVGLSLMAAGTCASLVFLRMRH